MSGKNLTRKDLSNKVFKNLGFSKNLSSKILDDFFETLISEIMLQQTRVKTVLKYYKKFLKQFPDIKTLALADEEKVLKAWSGMGYYRRALNLHATAKIILKKYNKSCH